MSAVGGRCGHVPRGLMPVALCASASLISGSGGRVLERSPKWGLGGLLNILSGC